MTQRAEPVVKFGAEGGSLTVERKKTGNTFTYRLHYYDCTALLVEEEEGLSTIDRRSKWFPSLEQALSSSKWPWWHLILIEVAPNLERELRRIAKTYLSAPRASENFYGSWRRKKREEKEKKEAKPVIEFGVEGGSLIVEQMKTRNAFKYRLYCLDRSEEDKGIISHLYLKWFSSLERALSSSRWPWWNLPLIKVMPDLENEFRRIAKLFPPDTPKSFLSDASIASTSYTFRLGSKSNE
ncbi:MAG: hypothetical protein LBP90_06570 [Burkholderiales bacterium]|jgi:hypothetical protein|nr:hypothetical protein [Burkholderiales bacterium]